VYGVVRGGDVPDIFAFDGHFHSAGVAALARVLSEIPIDESVRAFAVDHQILGDGVRFIGERLSVLLESRVAVFGCGCRLDPKDVVNEVESDGANAWMEVVWDGVSSGLIVSVLSLDDDGGSVENEEASFGGDAMDFSDDGDDGLQIGLVVGVVCVVACVVVGWGCECEVDSLVGDGCEGVQRIALNDLHGRRLHLRFFGGFQRHAHTPCAMTLITLPRSVPIEVRSVFGCLLPYHVQNGFHLAQNILQSRWVLTVANFRDSPQCDSRQCRYLKIASCVVTHYLQSPSSQVYSIRQ